jgi:hypothetical protein
MPQFDVQMDALDNEVRTDIALGFEALADFRDTIEQGGNPMDWLMPVIEQWGNSMVLALMFAGAYTSSWADVTSDELRDFGSAFRPEPAEPEPTTR